MVQLAESTIRTNSRDFEGIEDVPREAITLGMGTIIVNSRSVLLLANGEEKAQAIKNVVDQYLNEGLQLGVFKDLVGLLGSLVVETGVVQTVIPEQYNLVIICVNPSHITPPTFREWTILSPKE